MLAPGSLILSGRFRIVRTLGSGGMGEVYLAEQVLLGRKVAVKVLHPEVKSQQLMAERFHREARLLSSIEHPSVVRVVEYGQEGDASFLVMEFAEGDTLHTVLQHGPLEPLRALGILVQLADGLAAIHAAGIVHRDLKPENVVLSPAHRGETARLLDFGIARLIGAADSPLSQIGTVLGTPEYLSPEQATGAPVDARTDLYSLGVLAYRVLTGVLPFTGPKPRDFLIQHVKEQPAPLESVHPPLAAHPALCAHVLQLLVKEPGRRPESAQLFADSLRGLLTTTGTSGSNAQVPSPAEADFGAPVPKSGTAAFAALSDAEAAPLLIEDAAAVVSGNAAVIEKAPPLPPPVKKPRGRAWLALGGIAAVGVAVLLATSLSTADEERIQALIEKGQLGAALERIAEVPEDALTPKLHSLRATALHKKGHHREEHAKLRALEAEALSKLDASVFESLAEDFGRNESSAVLLKLLASFPEEQTNRALLQLAEGKASAAQWGALRYLDELKRTERLDLPLAYASALSLESCKVKIAASKRLAALGDERTKEALKELASAPRDRGFFSDTRCGQQEAAAALKALNRK